MAATYISDLIIPEVFAPYFTKRSMELSAVLNSGVMVSHPQLVDYATGAGQTFQLPFFQDLTGDDEILTEGVNLTINKISTEREVCVVTNRAKAWGATYLSRITSGEQVLDEIANLVSNWWARKHQSAVMGVLKALFLNSGGGTDGVIRASHLTSGGVFDPLHLIDAMGDLGDAAGQISAMAMHSAIYRMLQKNDLIDYQRDSEANIEFPTYLGKRVIVDDSCTSETAGTYRTYLFATGAFQFGMGSIPARDAVETDRNSLGSEDILITRQRFIIHPRGFKYGAGVNPSNTVLSDPASWTKVYENKAIPIVALESTLV